MTSKLISELDRLRRDIGAGLKSGPSRKVSADDVLKRLKSVCPSQLLSCDNCMI